MQNHMTDKMKWQSLNIQHRKIYLRTGYISH